MPSLTSKYDNSFDLMIGVVAQTTDANHVRGDGILHEFSDPSY